MPRRPNDAGRCVSVHVVGGAAPQAGALGWVVRHGALEHAWVGPEAWLAPLLADFVDGSGVGPVRPGRRQSGDRDQPMSITKAGDQFMRGCWSSAPTAPCGETRPIRT